MRSVPACLTVFVALALACGQDSPLAPADREGPLEVAAAGSGRPLSAILNGANERPNPGDPDGAGRASVRLDQGAATVCWSITWQNIGQPTAAHIHRGNASVAGPIEVTLVPVAGGCTGASPVLIKEIRKNPASFYVNVHTEDFPGGAIRGQLSR